MYVPLRVQSCFSILDSTIPVKGLAKAAARLGLPAVGLADRGALHGALSFSRACLEAGVQPLVGVLLPVVRPVAPAAVRPGAEPPVDGLVLYAQGEAGYANLLALVSDAHLGAPPGRGPALPFERLAGRADGLIALTAGADGALARLLAEGQDPGRLIEPLLGLFGDRLFIEIGRSGEPVEEAAEEALIDLADRRGLPLVGTAMARFLEPSGHEAHDVMLCIADSTYIESSDRRRSNPEQWLLDEASFRLRFADLPEAIDNTLLVARRTAFAARPREPVLPQLEADAEAESQKLRAAAEAGLEARLAAMPGADPGPYRARLDHELGIIARMGFSGYFLIVADFIGWAKGQGIPVGPGRGSGAGSLVAWALSITDLDPLAFGLLFERFLNPERRSMPDFDIDFCETRRDEVIRYVQARFGADQVAQIVTFGTLKARAVVKDVGRVLQMPYGEVDRLAKLIPANPADPWDLARALDGVPELQQAIAADPRVDRLIRIARTLEGLPRHHGTHAAGVVIADRPLARLVPLLRDARSDFPVTQFDLKSAEDAGLVKFDFLGLKTLSVLARAVELLAQRGIAVDLASLPLDDPAVFDLLTRGDTVGVFQFESEGMRRALALVRPTLFEDLVALGALYRPGPMDNIPSFAARKWGREEVDWLHPLLEPILRPTYGIIIYQEQVMQIAQELAGYSLGEADLLRRAMGKKIKAEMDAQAERFVEGAVARGVPRERAEHIFRLVEKFAGYGFNKSHAAAYALIAWQTAWMKAHHPAAFYAATMAFDIADTDKLKILVDDARRAGVPVLPPCINRSGPDFTLEEAEGRLGVRHALAALKGVGEAAMAELVAERDAGGAFRSLDDWVGRVDPRLLNKRQVEALAGAGAFECLVPDRARLYAAADLVLAAAQAAARARAEGQGGLFATGPAGVASVPLPPVPPWRPGERLAREREAYGFYWSGHPIEAEAAVLEAQGALSSSQALALRGDPESGRVPVTLAGLVEDFRWVTPQGRGPDRRYLRLDLSDQGGSFQASCFERELCPALTAACEAGTLLLLDAELSWREGDEAPRIAIIRARPMAEVARQTRLLLEVRLAGGGNGAAAIEALAALPRGGRIELVAEVPTAAGWARLRLARDIAHADGIAEMLRRLPGIADAQLRPPEPPALRLVA